MFEQFKKFVGLEDEKQYTSPQELLTSLQGQTFLNGMFRIFKASEIDKWSKIVEEAFPAYKNQVDLFSYDWMGRIFALSSVKGTVLMFEPGTGWVLDIPVNIVDFLNSEIVKNHEAALASSAFNEWYEAEHHYALKHSECVGYKIPLFLNGNDVIENMEVSDMEVYWEIMAPLINL